jgi:hypothetical protein
MHDAYTHISQGGIYLFELFQEYTANVSLVVIGFFEVITVAYIYGVLSKNNFHMFYCSILTMILSL